MRTLTLVAFLITPLTGCVGFSTSDNDAIYTDHISHAELASLETEAVIKNHPKNGSKIYNEKTAWCGVTIIAIIPIPLLVPVCSSSTEVVFENSVPIRKVEHYVGQENGFICGPLLPLIPYGDGSGSGFCRDH